MSRRNRKTKKRLKSLMWMIVLTGMLLIFSTYAWFSTNKVVEITGIHTKVAAAEGLQISLDGETWSSTIDLSTAEGETVPTALTKVGTTKNNYTWPTELNPVSTGGTTPTGDLQFYAGEVKNDGLYLAGAGLNTNYFVAFDIYFKNASSNPADYLQLNSGSKVVVPNIGDVVLADQTGLEYSVRIGLLLYGSTAGVTATGEAVRELSVGTPRVSIWEPNAAKHINEVATNDARVSGTDSAFTTLGIIAAPQTGTGEDATLLPINYSKVKVTDADDDADNYDASTYLKEQHTLTTETGTVANPTYMPLTTSTASAVTTTPTAGAEGALSADYLTLGGNTITKARMYIWLEGQDPDCIDTASTGKQMDIDLSFTKPSTT